MGSIATIKFFYNLSGKVAVHIIFKTMSRHLRGIQKPTPIQEQLEKIRHTIAVDRNSVTILVKEWSKTEALTFNCINTLDIKVTQLLRLYKKVNRQNTLQAALLADLQSMMEYNTICLLNYFDDGSDVCPELDALLQSWNEMKLRLERARFDSRTEQIEGSRIEREVEEAFVISEDF